MKFSIVITLSLLLISNSCTPDKKVLVIGHRGAMGHKTENTLASVQEAIELGADMVEIDVYQCRSKEIVVFHDEKVDRLTDGEGFIEDLNFFQLRFLTVNGGHTIPLLQDVIKLVNRRCILNIELKGKNTVERVTHILQYYIEKKGWKPEEFLISSFDAASLRDFYALNQTVPIGVLVKGDPLEALKTAREVHAVSIHAYYEDLTEENIKTLQKEGFKVYAGVVNEAADIQKMKTLGVDGIFTNFPERVR